MADHDDLERTLRMLGRRLDLPPEPPATRVVRAVRARLESPPARRMPVLRYAAVVVALLVCGALVAVPQVRAAIVELFRIGGVVVNQAPGPSLPATPTLPQQPVADLAEAERLTGLRVVAPELLGPPDQILVIEGRVVSLVYRVTAGRPAIRFDQFNGGLEPAFEKHMLIRELRQVPIGGSAGWWVPGPHEVVYVDASGQPHRESARLAAATLIWERDGVTFRLEGELDLERSAAIAGSVPP